MKFSIIFAFALAACSHGGEDHHHDTDDTDASADTDLSTSAFSLSFLAMAKGAAVGCGAPVSGLGPDGLHSVGINDIRFYVSNVVFRDEGGAVVPATFDEDDFQYTGTNGWVALVDLTGNTGGDCADGSISFSEGTARTHTAVTGTTAVGEVKSVSFDVGVPQALMKEVIADNTIEGAPSPLAEMYWSWASGYRHFVVNLTTSNGDAQGEGYLHVGSVGCAGEGELALESKAACDYVNTPKVSLESFNLASDSVAVDVGALVAGLDFVAPVYDPETFEEIGEQEGLECHSFPSQPDCQTFLGNLGVNLSTGVADAGSNAVFHKR